MTRDLAAVSAGRPALLGGEPLCARPIRLTEPSLPPLADIVPDLEVVWASRQLTNNGPFARELKQQLSHRVGVNVVPTASGTVGLMVALKALGIDGEVVVPTITFSATAHAVVWAGATPVFADVDPATWCLTPDTIAPRLTARTQAILAVHLFGQPCDIDALVEFSQLHGLALVLDAAQAFGSTYADGRPVGSRGHAEVFSFHATKILPAGEAGAIATRDSDLGAAIARTIRFGDEGDGVARQIGLNGKITEWAAILALHGLPDVEAHIARRSDLAGRYRARLAGVPGVSGQRAVAGARSNQQMFPLVVDTEAFGLTAGRLAEALAAEGIEARRYYFPPLHRQPAFSEPLPGADRRSGSVSVRRFAGKESVGGTGRASVPQVTHLPAADALAERMLCLPLYSHMEEHAVDEVATAIERCHQWRGELATTPGE
jgi:dTDP-4-amino-4,6-dideoxygalactose transaminase